MHHPPWRQSRRAPALRAGETRRREAATPARGWESAEPPLSEPTGRRPASSRQRAVRPRPGNGVAARSASRHGRDSGDRRSAAARPRARGSDAPDALARAHHGRRAPRRHLDRPHAERNAPTLRALARRGRVYDNAVLRRLPHPGRNLAGADQARPHRFDPLAAQLHLGPPAVPRLRHSVLAAQPLRLPSRARGPLPLGLPREQRVPRQRARLCPPLHHPGAHQHHRHRGAPPRSFARTPTSA